MAELRVVASASVSAPPERVWELISDTSRYADWVAGTDEVTRTDGPAREGSTYDEVNPILGPWKARSRWTVTEFDPPRRQVHRGEGLPLTSYVRGRDGGGAGRRLGERGHRDIAGHLVGRAPGCAVRAADERPGRAGQPPHRAAAGGAGGERARPTPAALLALGEASAPASRRGRSTGSRGSAPSPLRYPCPARASSRRPRPCRRRRRTPPARSAAVEQLARPPPASGARRRGRGTRATGREAEHVPLHLGSSSPHSNSPVRLKRS